MSILRTSFVVASLACSAAWLLKMVAIPATGGADSESVVVGVLWAVGMVGYLLACGLGVALLLRPAPVWARTILGLLAVPVSFALLDLLDGAIKSVYRADGWFRDEVALVVAALVVGAWGLAAAGARHGRGAGARVEAPARGRAV